MNISNIHEELEVFLNEQLVALSRALRGLKDSEFFRKEQQIINHFILRVPHLNINEAKISRGITPDKTRTIVMDVHYDGSPELMKLKHCAIKSDKCREEHIWSEHLLRLHAEVGDAPDDQIKTLLKENLMQRVKAIGQMVDKIRWHNQRVDDMVSRHRKTAELRSGIVVEPREEKRGFFDFLFRRKNRNSSPERLGV